MLDQVKHSESASYKPSSQNLAQDAAQVQQLTTYEVLNAMHSKGGRELSKNDSVVRLGLDSTLDTSYPSRWQNFKDVLYRSFPHGLKANRLGIQWTCISAFSSILLYIKPPNHWFWGPVWTPLAVYICINSLTTIEMATGATNRNAVLRILGTTLAALLSFTILLPMVLYGWQGSEDHFMVRWIMYYACVPSPFIWNFFIYHFPDGIYENFHYQGLSTQVYLYGSYSTLVIYDMCICTIGCYIGTILGFIGYQLFIPLRARDKLTHEVSLICYKMSYALEPLIKFEGEEASMGDPLYRRKHSKMREWKANSKRMWTKPSFFKEPAEPKQESPMELRNEIWAKLNDALKLMESHQCMIGHARREHYWTKPHFFYSDRFSKMHNDCKAIYYHITSLFLLFEAKLTTTQQQTAYWNIIAQFAGKDSEIPNNLGDNNFGGLFDPTPQDIPKKLSRSQSRSVHFDDEHSEAEDEPSFHSPSSQLDHGSLELWQLYRSETNQSQPEIRHQTSHKPPDTMYTPFEALSTARLPKYEFAPLFEVPLKRQSSAPVISNKSESLTKFLPKHAHTQGTLKRSASVPQQHSINFDESTMEVKSLAEMSSDKPQVIVSHIITPPTSNPPSSSAASGDTKEDEIRTQLEAAAQEEKNEILDALQSVRNQLVVEGQHLVVPEISASPPEVSANELIPPSPSSSGKKPVEVPACGDLDILIVPPAENVDEPPLSSARVVGLAPVVKWATVFGPLIGETAKELADVLEMLGEALDHTKWNNDVWTMIENTEKSIAKLVHGKRDWWAVSMEMASLISKDLITKAEKYKREDASENQSTYEDLEAKLCLPWLGLTLDAYGRLPPVVKDDLWISFESMQDRQVATIKTCVALMRRVKSFANNVEEYLCLQFPSQQPSESLEKFRAELESSANLGWHRVLS